MPQTGNKLKKLELKTDLGSLNTPNPFLHRIIAPAASWTFFSFTHSSPLLRQVQSPSILQDSSKNHIFLILGTASPIPYINIVLCNFWSALADIISLIWLNAVWVYSLYPSIFYRTGSNSPSPQQELKPLTFSALREFCSPAGSSVLLFTKPIFFGGRVCPVACGILVPWPGIEPVPPVLGMWSLSHWTPREVWKIGEGNI